jgi:phosphoglycerate dehydrogenase-like enzyme
MTDNLNVLFIGFQDIVHPWYDDFLEALDPKYKVDLYDPAQPLEPQFRQRDVVVDQGGWGTHEMIDVAFAGGVKLWQVIGTGLDHLDVSYVLEKGIPLSYSPGFLSGIALAEQAIFLMLCLAKNLSSSGKNVRAGVFYHPMNEELQGKTLGLIGFGGSGRELAKRAWALGMRVVAIDVADIPPAVCEEYHVEFLGDPAHLETLLKQADYVSLHVPLNSKTHHMIDRHAFDVMKPTSSLINVARGEIVDDAALVEALQTGKIRGAGLDVFSQEPLPVDHPLLHMDNVIATPHIAGATRGTSQRRGRAAAENISRVAKGLAPLFQLTAPL